MTWTHVRLVRRPDGRFRLITAFLGNPLYRLDCQAAGLPDTDPANLTEPEAARVGSWMDRWITEQEDGARKARNRPEKALQNQTEIGL